MIVNLSYYEKDIEYLEQYLGLDNKGGEKLLDLTGAAKTIKSVEHIAKNDIDPEGGIERDSVRAFVNEAGDWSASAFNKNKNIRDFKVYGLSVYWLTSISLKFEKNPVGLNLFYFFELLKLRGDYFKNFEKIIIHLPNKSNHIRNWVVSNVQSYYEGEVKIISVSRESPISLLKGLKSLFRDSVFPLFKLYFVLKKKIIHGKSKNVVKGSISYITFFPSTWKEELRNDVVLCDVKRYLEQSRKSVYVPFFLNLVDVARWDWKNDDSGFANCYPSFKDLIKLVFSVLVQFIRVSLTKNKNLNEPDQLLLFEIQQTLLSRVELMFMGVWLSKYSSKIGSDSIVFYQDEIYTVGKLISHFMKLGNENVKTIGYQHGIITKNHTHYIFSDKELRSLNEESNDGVPFPDFLFAWGDFFSKIITSKSTLLNNKVVSIGNIKYCIQRSEDNISLAKSKISNKTILWCTGRLNYALVELDYMKEWLVKHKPVLKIRMHPLLDIKVSLSKIFEDLNIEAYWDDSKTFEEALDNVGCVLTNINSTVFLNCVVYKIPVIGIYYDNSKLFDIDGVESDHCYTAKNANDMEAALNNIVLEKSEDKMSLPKRKEGEIFYFDLDKWRAFKEEMTVDTNEI